jgi:hypothetical protein
MIKKLEQYRFEGSIHKQALRDIPKKPEVSILEREQLESTARYSTFACYFAQLPVILGCVYGANRWITPLKTDKRMLAYLVMFGGYMTYSMMSEAVIWHKAYERVEPIVK